MKPQSRNSASHTEPELHQILEEIADRISSGEDLNVESYVERLPEHAEPLRDFVASMQLLVDFGDADSVAKPTKAQSLHDVVPASRILGDFRVLGELGRGGMGIVYEAEQISLERIVALKILPFAAILDDRQLQRFKIEARAAATLHHPHIVPVFSVGSDRGVHYYAMQKIDGSTLAELLVDMRQAANGKAARKAPFKASIEDAFVLESADALPQQRMDRKASSNSRGSKETRRQQIAELSTKRSQSSVDYFRTIARWGMETAEALAYAHEHGIVHRDIKPGNLMLDRDGNIWVTDFGLARIESEASMTISGDIVGTLKYMAPEQVLGNSALVDHRADIYSLGVTLYELATGQAAFNGTDRNELTYRITTKELSPPRKLAPGLPVDLETIILKAASKAPEDRYATAQEFAEDLGEFLADRPIRAKPPNLIERTRKWTKRHPGFVWSTGLFLLLISLFSLAGFLWAQRTSAQLAAAAIEARQKTEEANQALARESLALTTARSASSEKELALIAAQAAELEARRNLYLSTMRQAHADLQRGDMERFAESMVRFIPARGEPDLRGWEWYYLQSLYQQAEQVLYLHTGVATAAAWHPQGTYLATAGGNGVICLWNPGTWQPAATFTSSGVRAISWHPGGELLAAADLDGIIRIWDTRSGLVRKEIVLAPRGKTGLPPSRCDELAFSPDGTKLAAAVRQDPRNPQEDLSYVRGCRAWDTTDFQELWSYEPAEANSVTWSPDGRQLAFSNNTAEANDIVILDANRGAEIRRITSGSAMIFQVRWSPAGDRIATCEGVNGIKVFDVESKKILCTTTVDSLTENIRWSADGERLAVGEGRVVQIYDKDLTRLQSLKGQTGNMSCLAWNTHGTAIAAGATDGMFRIWQLDRDINAIGARPVCADSFDVKKRDAYFSRTRRFLATLDHDCKSIVVRRVSDGAIVQQIQLESDPLNIAWSGDDTRLACILRDGLEVAMVDLANGRRQSLFSHDDGKIHDVDWNPVNSHLAAAIETNGKAGQIEIWNAETSELIQSISVGKDAVVGVAWDPLGRRLASVESAGVTAIVRIWDPGNERELGTLTGHVRQTGKLQWKPTGDYLAAFGWDGKVTIWDTQQSRLQCRLHGHSQSLRGAWHPTEERFLTHGDDGTVRLWDALSGEEILRLDCDCNALMFGPTGAQLYLLGKSFDVVEFPHDQKSVSPRLVEFAAVVNMNRSELERAGTLIDSLEKESPECQHLLRRLFNHHLWKADGRDATVEGSTPTHMLKALDLWKAITRKPTNGRVPEYGATAVWRVSMQLTTVAINSPSMYRHYEKDPRLLLPAMQEVLETVQRDVPRERLAPGEEKELQDWLNLLGRRISEEEKGIPLVPGS